MREVFCFRLNALVNRMGRGIKDEDENTDENKYGPKVKEVLIYLPSFVNQIHHIGLSLNSEYEIS